VLLRSVPLDVSGPSAGVRNSAAINAALAGGGVVELVGLGVAYYSAKHVIQSNTHLRIPSGLTVRATDGSNCNFLKAKMFEDAPTTVTLTWAAGRACTVNWTAHGKSIGDAVWLRGAAQSHYRGVFIVESVTNANAFVVGLKRTPTTAATGTIYAVQANQNVRLTVDGLIDANWENNQGSEGVDRLVCVLGGDNIHVDKFTGMDGYKYLLAFGAVRNFSARNFTSIRTHSDGIKVYGPAFDGEIRGVRGFMQDDALSLQPREPSAYTQYEFTLGGGDILGVKAFDIQPQATTASAFIIYASDTEIIDDSGIDGGACSATQIPFRLHGGYASSIVGNVWFRGLERIDLTNPAFKTTGLTLTAERVDVDVTSYGVGVATGSPVETGSAFTAKQVNIKLSATGAAGGNTILLAGTIDQVNVQASVSNTGSSGRAVVLSGGIKNLNMTSSTITGGECAVFVTSSQTVSPKVTLTNSRIDCTMGVRIEEAGTEAHVSGNQCAGMGSGFIRVSGVSASVTDGGGNTVPAGNYLRRVGGTEAVSITGAGAQVDVTTITRTAGSVVYNTNAAAGTLAAAGLVACDVTGAAGSWKLLTNPALNY